jgi:hypothetical protein
MVIVSVVIRRKSAILVYATAGLRPGRCGLYEDSRGRNLQGVLTAAEKHRAKSLSAEKGRSLRQQVRAF